MKRDNGLWRKKRPEKSCAVRHGTALLAAVLLLSQPAFAAVVTSGGPGSTNYTQLATQAANSQSTTTKSKGTGSQAVTKVLETTDAVTPTETYNKELGMYEQEFGNGRRMVTSIANGSQVSDYVYIQVPDNSLVRLELDGREHTFQNTIPLTEAGYYVMLVSSTVVGSTKRADAVFRFRILPPPSDRQNTGEYVWPKVACELEKTTIVNKGLTLFTMTNLAGLLTDVPGEGESVTSAEFFFPPNVGYVITRDNLGLEYHNKETLTEPGRYHVKIFAPSQAFSGDYAAFYESGFDFVIPSNADNSLLATSAQPVSGGSGSSLLSGSGSSVSSGAGSDLGTVNAGSEITYQSDMVTETYRSEVGLYEEQFSNGILFYTNVPDKAIVGGDVYLDIPADVGVKMKRDGKEVPFINKERINEEGTYLLTLTSNTNLGEDKNIYQSFFHFRVQPGSAMAGTMNVNAGGADGEAGSQAAESATEETEEDGTLKTDEELAAEAAEAERKAAEESAAAEEAETDGSGRTGAAGRPKITDAPDGEGYDESQALFSYTFPDSTLFLASAPRDAVSNAPVTLYLPEGGKGTIDTGTRTVDLPNAVSVNEDGTYHAVITSAGGDTVDWDFQVMSGGTNSMEEIKAPNGYYIDSIVKGEALVEDCQYTDSYRIDEDGTYTVSFMPYYHSYPEWFLVVDKDTVAPELTFEGLDENAKATGKEVSFTCSEEGAAITLLRGKKAVELKGNVITGGGKYTITATDAAGNASSYAFRIPSQASLITVIAILFMLILALGFMTYYKVYGEKFKVR